MPEFPKVSSKFGNKQWKQKRTFRLVGDLTEGSRMYSLRPPKSPGTEKPSNSDDKCGRRVLVVWPELGVWRLGRNQTQYSTRIIQYPKVYAAQDFLPASSEKGKRLMQSESEPEQRRGREKGFVVTVSLTQNSRRLLAIGSKSFGKPYEQMTSRLPT